MPKPRVLIVDDEIVNIKLLEAYLSAQGYIIDTAGDGAQALDKAFLNHYDAILLDVMMPGINGFEVTQKLRAHESTRLVPIVLITALKETSDRIKGIEAGCDDFISKPFDKNEVLARIKTLLRLSYYRNMLDEKEKFEYVLENIGAGIAVCDASFNILQANDTAKRFLNITVSGAEFFSCVGDFKLIYDGDAAVDLKDKNVTFYLERAGTDTVKALILQVNASTIKNSLGQAASIVFMMRDVTLEQKREKDKQSFLALISHKMRTPLLIVSEVVSQLDSGLLGPVSDKQKDYLAKGLRSCYDLRSLIDGLLGFAEITQASELWPAEETELKGYIPALIMPIIKYAEGKKVLATVDCAEGLVTTMNKVYFDMIVDNLMNNAIKFNNNAEVNINISVTVVDDRLQMAIHDDGPGMPPEELENIFEKFYQIDRHNTGNIAGAGLGLAIVRYLAQRHGGRAWAESRLGQGSTFYITLPKR